MNTGTFRSWRAHASKTMRPLLSALLLFSVVAEIVAPVVVQAAPPLPKANEPTLSIAAEAAAGATTPLAPGQASPSLSAAPSSSEVAADGRHLPPAMIGLTEIVERRSLHSAIFAQTGDQSGKHFTAILSAAPLHYRDADGNWQAIDAAFRPLDNSFTVAQNSLLSRAGREKAWLSAVADETAILWEAQTLAVVDANGKTIPLANALTDPTAAAQRSDKDSVLRYTSAWSDPTLAEELHSAPDSLEHLMILAAPPQTPPSIAGTPAYLELQADLQLLPGATLWADGVEHTSAFTTGGALEIHNSTGNSTSDAVMILEPVIAFEEAHPHIQVPGEYILTPGDKAGHWRVGVRTPWQWWQDEGRQYPAVIDPVIRVNRSTGYGDGIAWLGNNDAWSYNGIAIGPFNGANSEAEGYVQFNSFPGLLSEAPIQIKQAFLDVEPSGLTMPYYKHPSGDYPDWEHEKIQRTTELLYLGSCPLDAGCNGFSLQENAPTNNWASRPLGVPVAAGAQKELVAGPLVGGGETTVTSWDVTAELANWYANYYTTPSYPKPAFRLRFTTGCGVAGPYIDDKSAHIPACTYFHIPAGNVRLRIEYEELQVTVGTNLLNQPGVPGFLDGVLQDTAHQYDLAVYAGDNHWRGVAVRGNHDFVPGPATRTGIRLMDETSGDPVLLTTAATASAEETTFILIDDHNTGNFIATANLKALVTASNENNLPADPERNYRLHYLKAAEHTVPIGDWYKIPIAMDSLDLLNLHEFHLDDGDKVAVRAVLSPTVDLILVEPTGGNQKQDAVMGNNDSRVNRGFQPTDTMTRTLNFSTPRTGFWALGLVNQGPPIPRIAGVTGSKHLYQGYVEILRCPIGTIPTDKWKCQPLRLPDDTIPPSKTANGLTVYSEGGFGAGPGGVNSWCTHNEGSGAPIIGPSQSDRWTFVGQGSVCYNDGTGALYTTPDSGIGLAVPIPSTPSSDKRGDYQPTFIFGDTSFSPVPGGLPDGETILTSAKLDFKDAETRINIRPFHEHWEGEFEADPTYIDLAQMMARGAGVLHANLGLSSDSEPFAINFDTEWNLFPNPVPSVPIDPPRYTFNSQIAPDAALPIPMDLASLSVRVMQDGTDIPDGRIKFLDSYLKASGPSAGNLRADSARVTQGAELGGATKQAKVVVQPPGLPRQPDNEKSCFWQSDSSSCLDLRVPEYAWANGDGEKSVARWELPDIHLTDGLGTLMVSSAGQLTIFSADHPDATDVSQSFSFDTWGATVSVTQEPCMEGEPETVVVRGQALIAMPNVGDDGSAPPSIEVSFKLCETALRMAKLVFSIPAPGIPVGSTGVGVNLIGGTVTVGKDSVQIVIDIGFQTMDGVTLKNGKGTVTIDTAGLFSLQASGKIVSVLDAQLLLQVAWNPLDLLFEAEVGYKNLIEGGLRMHAWIGQGWQGKYSWLPDNDDFHFTGMIWASLNIESGMIVDEGLFKLPPFSFSLKITISFGEFCTNSSCTSYSWGMSATLTVLGYDVGMYVDSSGPELILGTDNHKLIDQFGGAMVAMVNSTSQSLATDSPALLVISPGMIQPLLTPIIESPVDTWLKEEAGDVCAGTATSVHTCPFTVDPGTGRALFSASWENGSLGIVLIKPDNTVIDASNAISHSTIYSTTTDGLLHQVSYAVSAAEGQTLMSGQWQMQLSNVGVGLDPGFENNYHLLYASDPPAPTIAWSAPATAGVTPDSSGNVNLSWSVTRGGQSLSPDLPLELFYVPAAGKPVTPTEMAGNIIVNGISAAAGTYSWNTSGLASGEYAVGARVDDHQQGNGHIVAWASGTIVVVDTLPPPVPHIAGKVSLDDALLVTWQRDDVTPDLSGYLVEYTIPDWDFSAPQVSHVRRITPRSKFEFPLFERVRLGGLLFGQPTTVCVRSFDASGNVSGCEEFTTIIRPTGCPLGELTGLAADRTGRGEARITWDRADCGEPDGYMVNYRPVGCRVPGLDRSTEDPAPIILVPNPGQFHQDVRGLTDFQTYWVGVRAYTNLGELSPERTMTFRMIDPTDANTDGVPDGWAALYGLANAGDDPDQDGLDNKEEFDLASDPLVADSDEDSFYDWEEADWGTDICGPQTPPYHKGPRLQLSGLGNLTFSVATNNTISPAKKFRIFNGGGGQLQWAVNGSEPWIEVNPLEGIGPGPVEIHVNTEGLAPGVYTGMVEVHTGQMAGAAAATGDTVNSTAQTVNETVTIPVRVEVLPPKMAETTQQLLLPVISK